MSRLLALVESMNALPEYNGETLQECTWGKVDSQMAWAVDDGGIPVLLSVTTPSHGGFWVHPDFYTDLPQWVKDCSFSKDNWFEGDCSWMVLYLYLNLNRLDPRSQGNDDDIRDMFARVYPEAYKEYINSH